MRFAVKVNGMADLAGALDRFPNDLRFAQAMTLTRVAQAGQAAVRDALPEKFIIRRTAWASSGIVITPATKERLQSEVADRNSCMVLQESGGEKIPYKQFLAIPLEGARPSPRALIKTEDRPAEVMARGGFIRENTQGIGIMFLPRKIFHRARRRRGMVGPVNASKEQTIVPMYALVRRAEVPARYGMEQTVSEAVDLSLDASWNEAVELVLRQAGWR
jgi:hypothetical protein